MGIDASKNFVEACIATGKYSGTHEMYLGNGEFPDKYKGYFDTVVASGVWLKGHIPFAGLDDVYTALTVGGYFITAMRSQYW